MNYSMELVRLLDFASLTPMPVTPAIPKANSPTLYDKFASRYDGFMRPLERRLLAKLRARTFSVLPTNARLLEVGAGTGANFPHYPERTSGAASEFSFSMIRIAREKHPPASINLIQSCAEQLPFANASFDAAVATLVFCTVKSPRDGLSEMRRVVKPGGRIVLLEHVRPDGFLGYVFDLLNLATAALVDDNINRRTAREAERAGLIVERVEQHALGILNIIVCRA